MRLLRLVTAAAVIALLAAACGSDDAQPSTSTPSTEQAAAAAEQPQAEPTVRPDRRPLIEGPVSPDDLKVILGTADLGVGPNRVGFVLTSATKGFVKEPAVTVSSSYFAEAGSNGEPVQTATAEYQPWPYGSRGSYTTWLDFGVAGDWRLEVSVEAEDGSTRTAEILFRVEESPEAPAVGAAAVRSVSKTVADVETLDQLATGSLLDEELYTTTIADAVASSRPTVIVFASPAFCTNAVCGPQVEVLQQLKDKFKDQANFIHVDFYDNPHEIQGDLSRAVLSPTVVEWDLPSIEWTFVIDRQGVVYARLEAFATYDEVEKELLDLL